MSRVIYDNVSVSMPLLESIIIHADHASTFRGVPESILFCKQAYHGVVTALKIHGLTDRRATLSTGLQG